ncbi:hypothetical protein PG988_013884 [Apiospora saccharicola]
MSERKSMPPSCVCSLIEPSLQLWVYGSGDLVKVLGFEEAGVHVQLCFEAQSRLATCDQVLSKDLAVGRKACRACPGEGQYELVGRFVDKPLHNLLTASWISREGRDRREEDRDRREEDREPEGFRVAIY